MNNRKVFTDALMGNMRQNMNTSSLEAWACVFTMFPDGVCYLDIGDP